MVSQIVLVTNSSVISSSLCRLHPSGVRCTQRLALARSQWRSESLLKCLCQAHVLPCYYSPSSTLRQVSLLELILIRSSFLAIIRPAPHWGKCLCLNWLSLDHLSLLLFASSTLRQVSLLELTLIGSSFLAIIHPAPHWGKCLCLNWLSLDHLSLLLFAQLHTEASVFAWTDSHWIIFPCYYSPSSTLRQVSLLELTLIGSSFLAIIRPAPHWGKCFCLNWLSLDHLSLLLFAQLHTEASVFAWTHSQWIVLPVAWYFSIVRRRIAIFYQSSCSS